MYLHGVVKVMRHQNVNKTPLSFQKPQPGPKRISPLAFKAPDALLLIHTYHTPPEKTNLFNLLKSS